MSKILLYFPPINKLGNSAFRSLCLDNGADFVFTEMIRVEKLLENEEHQLKKLYVPSSRKKVTFVQIITEDISLIELGVKKVIELFANVEEINYNMGCPQSSLCKNECGGGIVTNPILVGKVSKLLFDACSKFNVRASIKIRLGITRDNITIYDNIEQIKNAGIRKIYIHGRVLKDTYSKPATYNEIGLVKKNNPDLCIIANGDVRNLDSLNKILNVTNCDGVLIGRAALENPKIFNQLKNCDDNIQNLSGVELNDRIDLIRNYLEFAKQDNISISHIKANISYMTKGVINTGVFRANINQLNNVDDVIDYCNNF